MPIQSNAPDAPSTGRQAVAGFAHRHEAGAEEADVAGDIGIDEILRRRLIDLQSVEELAPVARRVEAHQRLRRSCRWSPRPVKASAIDLAGLGDAREILADVGEHRPVPRRAHVQLDVGARP